MIAAVVLAAGLSSRMGQSKHLLPWLNGQTVIEQILTQVSAAGVPVIMVITGNRAEEVAAKAQAMGIEAVYNPDYATGEMLSSLKTGLRHLPDEVEAVLVVLGDQPRIRAAAMRQIMAAFAAGKGKVIAPRYRGQRGHPMLISRAYFAELLALPPDGAPRDVVARHPDQVYLLDLDADAPGDLDTPEDYAAELKLAEQEAKS